MLIKKPSYRMAHLLLCAFLYALDADLQGQDYQKKISEQEENLKQLRNELSEYQGRLLNESQKEKNELDRLNDANRKISLLNKVLGALDQQQQNNAGRIRQLDRGLAATEDATSKLKRLIARRLVQIYKHRDENPLALVLTSQSFTQAYARLKYLRLIAEQDRKDLNTLRNKIRLLEDQKTKIREAMSFQQAIMRERQNEVQAIQGELVKRTGALKKIRRDKSLLKTLIDQRREDIQSLQAMIAELERKKAESLAAAKSAGKTTDEIARIEYKPVTNFGKAKGRLPYPVPGRIVTKFGNQVHPVLGTKTRYPGVGIQTTANAPVRAVANGRVSLVTFLRRFGNTIIIEHGYGYYTVYAHLGALYVQAGQNITAGDTIGLVDESDEGKSVLHFEIYKDREAVDPSLWLQG